MMRRQIACPSRFAHKGLMSSLVLVCLVIALVIGLSLTRSTFTRAREQRQQERQWQSLWLAESGVMRAVAAVRRDQDYRGETWQIPADLLDGSHGARVAIVVKPVDAPRKGIQIDVQATYPDASIWRVVTRRTRFLELPVLEP